MVSSSPRCATLALSPLCVVPPLTGRPTAPAPAQEEKWSGGSCESYGHKWHVGDVIGVFLDLIDRTVSKWSAHTARNTTHGSCRPDRMRLQQVELHAQDTRPPPHSKEKHAEVVRLFVMAVGARKKCSRRDFSDLLRFEV